MRLVNIEPFETEKDITSCKIVRHHIGDGYAEVVATPTEDIPTIDAVPVIRCAECKHQEDCEKQVVFWKRNYVTEQNEYQYNKIDFCSYGERKKPPETEGKG